MHRRAFDGRTEERRIVQRSHDADEAVVSLVAVANDRVVGHVPFSPRTVAGHGETVELVGLAPVGVLPEHRNEGVGSLLSQHGFGKCRAAGADAVVVLGDPGYCARVGFERTTGYGLGNEYSADEAFTVKPVHDGGLDDADGIVAWQPEFIRQGSRLFFAVLVLLRSRNHVGNHQ